MDNNKTLTTNGAVVFNSSNSKVYDFFALGGSQRGASVEEKVKLFEDAYNEDKDLAVRCLFYLRDVRGGQGERQLFRDILKHIALNNTNLAKKLLPFVAEYGRWDDLIILSEVKAVRAEILDIVKAQFDEDMKTDYPSLLGKWMPSESTGKAAKRKTSPSSARNRVLCSLLRDKLKLTPRDYRKAVVSLRRKIDIVEDKIRRGAFSEIDYSKIPSRAGMMYQSLFLKKDYDRYNQFLQKVAKGEAKINTGTLYPADVAHKALSQGQREVDVFWKNLKDYCGNSQCSALPIVDTSGSMTCGSGIPPIEVAVGTGLYLAERCHGPFKNLMMTFSSSSDWIEIDPEKNIVDTMREITRADWGGSTNIEAAFDKILNLAIENKLPQEALPNRLIIFSDMQFNGSVSTGREYVSTDDSFFDVMKKKYEEAGYTLPNLVFWNCSQRAKDMPMTRADNVMLVSGQSPSIMENVLQTMFKDGYEVMLDILNSERYAVISA